MDVEKEIENMILE